MWLVWLVWLVRLVWLAPAAAASAPSAPHIIFIIADDLGWNDVGFHGMSQIPTPNLDALAAGGRALRRYYTLPVCTPARAALLTGKHPIHIGMQNGVIYGMEPRGLPLSERILPQRLRPLGYRSHLVGKWHLGHYRKEFLPTNRGFESHLGFWTGKIDMYDHTNMEQGSWGFDFRRGFETAHDLFGKYATDVYTDEAVKIIATHNASAPLLLVLAHSAVHSGNPPDPLRAPRALLDSLAHINDSRRLRFAGMLSALDESVGRVTQALHEHGLLQHAVLVFSTDNGGVPEGFNDNAGSNYPLRGTKNTLWEGGVRGVGVVVSPLLGARGPYDGLMHISDWLPTLYSAAGGNVSTLGLGEGDGVDQWAALGGAGAGAGQGEGEGEEAGPRGEVLLNINDKTPTAAITVGDWKLLKGMTYASAWDGWYGPAARAEPYSAHAALASRAGRALGALGLMPSEQRLREIREQLTVRCGSEPALGCAPLQAACLFNLRRDPCERRNLAATEPERVRALWARLAALNASAVAPNNRAPDPRGDPRRWGRVYTNFGDYLLTNDAASLYL